MSNSLRAQKDRLLSRLIRDRKRIAAVIRVTLFVQSGRLLTLSAAKVNGRIVWSYELGPAAEVPSPLSVARRFSPSQC